jgi:serine/threonine protein phosphatase PrpC
MSELLPLDCARITAVGARSSNQDALASDSQDELTCFVMADGAGGHEGGEVASKLVIDAILEKFMRDASFSARALSSYIDWAIAKVAQSKKGDLRLQSMSATMTTLLIDRSNHCALWAHLGDTRLYMFRHGKIVTVSKDHSLAQRFVDAGYAKYEEIRQHPQRSMLFAAIGAEGDTRPEITQQAVDLQKGDAFLLCTDGFWEWVMEADMEESLRAANNSSEWLSTMNLIAEKNVGALNKNRDNFSAFTIWLHDPIAVR